MPRLGHANLPIQGLRFRTYPIGARKSRCLGSSLTQNTLFSFVFNNILALPRLGCANSPIQSSQFSTYTIGNKMVRWFGFVFYPQTAIFFCFQ